MSDLDEILQRKLSALESGKLLDKVLNGIGDQGDDSNLSELDHLVRLAAAVRNLPHPQPMVEGMQASRQNLAAARERTWPVSGRGQANQASRRQEAGQRRFGCTWNGAPILAGGLAVCLGFFLAALGGYGYWLLRARPGPPAARPRG